MPNTQDYIPANDAKAEAWLNNFVTVAEANKTVLTLTASDLLTLTNEVADYTNAASGQISAHNAYKSAVTMKKGSRKIVVGDVRTLVRKIQGVPGVPPELKQSLGINPRTTPRTKTAPITPTNVQVSGDETGLNELTWDGMGNKPGTNFIIEESVTGAAGTYTFVASVTATRYRQEGQTPGKTVWYRVTATRAGKGSAPSIPAAVYPAEQKSVVLEMKAA